MMDVDEDIFASFDLDEMRALEDGDLSLFSNLIDPNFRLGSGSGGSDSNPSPTSITPSSEELALALQMDEEDPKLLSSKFLAFKSPDGPTAANNGHFQPPQDSNIPFFHHNNNNNNLVKNNRNEKRPDTDIKPPDEVPAPPPLVVCPIEVSKTSITLQKNQLCACKECGKLFKSIWYLKQHAVRHSNERPFICSACSKAFKFRSNLYQHNCPDRLKQRAQNASLRGLSTGAAGINPVTKKRFYTRGIAYTEQYGSNQIPQQQSLLSNVVNNEELNQFEKLLYNTQPTGPPQQMANMFGAIGGTNMQSLDSGFPTYGQPLNFPIKSEMNEQQMGQGFGEQPLVDNHSVRNKPLDPEFIDNYLEKNRHRIYSCSECKIDFPQRGYLQRHMAYHTDMDLRAFGCNHCPQRFTTEKQLESHMQKHADDSPHRCYQCNGAFRSALALRRHKEQCRPCYSSPFGDVYQQQQQIISPNAAPFDQYAFIDSDNDLEEDPLKNLGLNRQKSAADSGMGSDSSTHSYNTSPISNRNGLDDELDLHPQAHAHHQGQTHQYPVNVGGVRQNSKSPNEKSGKDDETDSGFRSRLNSTAQSCSPSSSSFSSESGESPSRKFSKTGPHNPHEQQQMHGMPSNYSGGAQFHSGPSTAGYSTNGGYHQRASQQMTQNSNIHYDGPSGNNWSQFGSFRYSTNDYHSELRETSGPVALMLLPADFGASFLSGKKGPTFVERFEMLSIGDASVCAEGAGWNRDWSFGSDLEVADPQEVVEEAVRLFIKRLLAVFLDAAVRLGTQKHSNL